MGFEVKTRTAHPSTYTPGNSGRDYIVVHYTATQASAAANAAYFAGGDRGASAHYFVDDGEIWASVPEGDTAWHAGNWHVNCRSVGIEVVSDGRDFTEGEVERLAWLVRSLMERHGIPAERVIRHYDAADFAVGPVVDPHKRCPAPYVDAAKWAALHARITAPEQPEIPEEGKMAECLIYIDNDHEGYLAGDILYWSPSAGFCYLEHLDCVDVLQRIHRYDNDGRDLMMVHSGETYPWVVRLRQATNPKVADETYGLRN